MYLDWIKDISSNVDKTNKLHKSDLIELYDFSGINYITTEKIPRGKNERMEYHFESSHYTSKAGDIILDRLYGKNNFGIKLNNVDINTYTLNKKITLMSFFNSERDTVSEIKEVLIATAARLSRAVEAPAPPALSSTYFLLAISASAVGAALEAN